MSAKKGIVPQLLFAQDKDTDDMKKKYSQQENGLRNTTTESCIPTGQGRLRNSKTERCL